MTSLFIDTSTKFLVINIINDDKIVYNYCEEIERDISNKILPVIRDGIESNNLELSDIDKIFVVNGPGSFTGVRVGVTVAKVLAWSLKKDLIPISSLELIATTSVSTDYIVPAIDARRGFVYAGKYDANLNVIEEDSYQPLADINLDNTTLVSFDNIDGSIKPNLDVMKIINKHASDEGINPHKLVPNYLKKTEAEENLEKKANDKSSN